MIRAILFDKDGTLTDFRATWEAPVAGIVAELGQASGVPPTTIGAALGFDVAQGRIESGGRFVTATNAQTRAALSAATGWDGDRLATWLEPYLRDVEQVPVPGLDGLLGWLAGAGLSLGILTNAERLEAERHLVRIGLRDRFVRVIACDDGFGAKPDPGGAADFADRLGLERHEVVLVGDGLADLAAAHGAGLRAVAVLTGTQEADALAAAEAVLPDVTHLPGWLVEQGVGVPEA